VQGVARGHWRGRRAGCLIGAYFKSSKLMTLQFGDG
jgi:hypothetical protein